MEGADPAGSYAWNKALRRVEEIHRKCIAESADRSASGYGRERTRQSSCVRGGASAGRIQPDRLGKKSKADPGRYVDMGRGI